MAAINIRRYALSTLRITLCAPETIPVQGPSLGARVKLEFSATPDEGASASLIVDPIELGVPRSLDWGATMGRGAYAFTLPAVLAGWLRERLEGAHLNGALWLDLVKPYGYLGMVPWERLLADVVAVPVLRVPDFVVDPPKQTPALVDVALLALAPGEGHARAVSEAVVAAARVLKIPGSRPVRLHVFCDDLTGARAAGPLAALEVPVSLRTPDEAGALSVRPSLADQLPSELVARYPELQASLSGSTERVTNPWLRWVRDSLGETSIDLVHVICSGRLSLERGALLFPAPAGRGTEVSSNLVGVAEFCAFQAQVGAWGAGISSPPGNFSDLGSRQFADGLAQARPGPVLFHDAMAGDAWHAFREAYGFLASTRPSRPPPTGSMFLYCEPFRVARPDAPEETFEASARAEAAPVLESHQGVDSAYAETVNVPSWMAATERFIDLYKLQLKQLAKAAPDLEPARQSAQGIRSALEGLQGVVASFAPNARGKPGSE